MFRAVNSARIIPICSLALLAGQAKGAITFTDPSFENLGASVALVMEEDLNYNTAGNSTIALNTLTTDIWHVKNINQGQEGFTLEDKDSYKGFTSAPTGVTGEQFITGSRSEGNTRGLLQYVNDGGATTGTVTFSFDYWAHELNALDSVAGDGSISVDFFATNDPTQLTVDLGAGDRYDVLTGSGFITSGTSGYTTISAVNATTGFQTMSFDLDLGTGYDYVGVIIGVSDFTPYDNASGETISFDNFQFTAIPEPSSALLGVMGSLLILRRRRD